MSRFIKSVIQTYSRLLLFACGLLLGIQVPSFVDQYDKRLDAHFLEVSANIAGFQSTAELMFDGDMEALISYYRSSDDEVFERDAESIRIIIDRFNRISAERLIMQGNLVDVAMHVAFAADREIFDETISQYSCTVPLNLLAVQWGFVLAILLIISIDLCWFGCVKCVHLIGGEHKRHRPKSTYK
jgi:hypothetical protein